MKKVCYSRRSAGSFGDKQIRWEDRFRIGSLVIKSLSRGHNTAMGYTNRWMRELDSCIQAILLPVGT